MADEKEHTSRNIEVEKIGSYTGSGARRRSIWTEFCEYLMENKKWWLIPIILVILLFSLLLILAGTPLAPMIYAVW